jgi:hypothetical protein
MKSAYGRQMPAPDYELTCVEPGSPMGELLRRYWQPVCPADELKDLPKKVKLLGEEIVVFRDKKGRVGALGPHARFAALRSNGGGSRKEDCAAATTAGSTTRRANASTCHARPKPSERRWTSGRRPIRPSNTAASSSPIWARRGPSRCSRCTTSSTPATATTSSYAALRVWGDYSAGYVKDCNWLQHYVNVVDPFHLLVLHKMISGDQFVGAMMQGTPQLSLEKTSLGVRYRFVNDLPNGNRLVRYVECVVPNIANIHEPGTVPMRQDRASELSWVVPIDDKHFRGLSIVCWPLENGVPKTDWKPRTAAEIPERVGARAGSRSYEERQRNPDDLEAQEGQRPIAVHALENLAPSDIGVVMLRRMLREQIRAVADGRDPINAVRDSAANHKIRTNAWNTVLSHAETQMHDGEEI